MLANSDARLAIRYTWYTATVMKARQDESGAGVLQPAAALQQL